MDGEKINQVINIQTEINDDNQTKFSPKNFVFRINSDVKDANCVSVASTQMVNDEVVCEANLTETFDEPNFNIRPAIDTHEGEDFYYMLSPVRGICLIINNIRFEQSRMDRQGSEQEGRLLEKLFSQLGFQVKHLRNRTAKQIDEDFEVVSRDENNKKYDAFVAIILSHGNKNNVIEGVDHCFVSLESILEKFNNENCPLLMCKPKMFFIQCCRGNKLDRGIYLENTANSISLLPEQMPSFIRLPTWTDTVVCHSTIDGYVSIRNILTGSWFGDALVKVFCERAHDTEFNHLISLVNSRLAGREGDINAKQSLEVVYRGWCKKLYFNPGLSSS